MQPAELLALFAEGESLSGAGLAARTGVTRAAIWKQVEALRARGVPIEARGTMGYRLPWPLQMLDAKRIRAALPTPLARSGSRLYVWFETTVAQLRHCASARGWWSGAAWAANGAALAARTAAARAARAV